MEASTQNLKEKEDDQKSEETRVEQYCAETA